MGRRHLEKEEVRCYALKRENKNVSVKNTSLTVILC